MRSSDITVAFLAVPPGELPVGLALPWRPEFLTDAAPWVHLVRKRANVIGSPLEIPEKTQEDTFFRWLNIHTGGWAKPGPRSGNFLFRVFQERHSVCLVRKRPLCANFGQNSPSL